MADRPTKRAPRRPLVQQQCRHCGKEFLAKQSNIDVGRGVLCSKECQRNGRNTRCDKKPRPSYVCKCCGKVFSDGKRIREFREYCSNKCHGIGRRKDNKSHPRRKHAAELQRWAKAVILRDKACARCGVTERLQAHHVEAYSSNPELRLEVDNGIALCPPCHHAQHPSHALELYLSRGGKTVRYCVVCESPYVPGKTSQRTCSPKCGCELRYGAI